MSDEDLVRLGEAARILGMDSANVGKFLERHDVQPVIVRPYKRRWRRVEVQAAKDARDASRGAGERESG